MKGYIKGKTLLPFPEVMFIVFTSTEIFKTYLSCREWKILKMKKEKSGL